VAAVTLPFVVDEPELEQQERALAASGEARLDGLVALAWHLRQRNGRRASEIAAEARALAAQLALGEASARSAGLRLALVDAEVGWCQADYDGAQRLVDGVIASTRDARDLADTAAAADAHWLAATLASDLGDTEVRDASLQACETLACRLDDAQRTLIAQTYIAR